MHIPHFLYYSSVDRYSGCSMSWQKPLTVYNTHFLVSAQAIDTESGAHTQLPRYSPESGVTSGRRKVTLERRNGGFSDTLKFPQ